VIAPVLADRLRTVRAELVEAPSFFVREEDKIGRHFDRLSANGIETMVPDQLR
jgi:hypothetical protein